MIDFLGNIMYQEVFVLVVLLMFFALIFCICDCATMRNFNVDNSISLNSSPYKLQLCSLPLPDSKVDDLPLELTPETTFVEVLESSSRKTEI